MVHTDINTEDQLAQATFSEYLESKSARSNYTKGDRETSFASLDPAGFEHLQGGEHRSIARPNRQRNPTPKYSARTCRHG